MNSDDYLRLERTVSQLRTASQNYAKTVKPTECDKKGVGFNKDNRFSAFSLKVSFDSWHGYYGDSGCSTVISFSDCEAVKSAFVAYLNGHMWDILKEMADTVEKGAAAKKQQYAAELEAELARLRGTP
jgi:hypothetical protein